MSISSKKITIYSSPQPLSDAFLSHKLDMNHNTKPVEAPAHLAAAGTKSHQDSACGGVVPQRTTLRLRISDPKELEMLQLAASRGCATLGGRQVRIVSVQKSHTLQVPAFSSSSSLEREGTAATVSSVSSACRTQDDVCVRTRVSSPSQMFCNNISLSSARTDIRQTSSAAVTQLCSNSSQFLTIGTSLTRLNAGCEEPVSELDFRSQSKVAACITTSNACANIGSNSLENSVCNSVSMIFNQTVVPYSLSSGVMTSSCAGLGQNFSSINCSSAKPYVPTVNKTNIASFMAPGLVNISMDSEKLTNMGSQQLPNHSSVTIRTMTSQGAKYLGTFAVNGSPADSQKLATSDETNCFPTGANSQKVVLRISSKNNAVDVKSLMSSERLPMLVKAIEKVLSANGVKSSTSEACPPNSTGADRHAIENSQNVLSSCSVATSKPAFHPTLQKTWQNSMKRQNAFNNDKTHARKAAYNQKYKALDKSFNGLASHKDMNSLDYVINNSLSMGMLSNYIQRVSATENAPNRPKQGSLSQKSSGKKGVKELAVRVDGCQSLKRLDQRFPSYNWWCARHRPFATRKRRGIFSFLLSKYRKKLTFSSPTNHFESSVYACGLPVAARFRQLRDLVKNTVDVQRSSIHGLGLYSRRHIDESEMIVEYAGEVIRASVADIRERRYEAEGIGCYMFRHGDDDVVDATRCGNVARFINHSCEPNCYSREVLIDGRRHIVIFALRSIQRGEELTYDYKFPIEDVKMPCLCSARRCRKYLN